MNTSSFQSHPSWILDSLSGRNLGPSIIRTFFLEYEGIFGKENEQMSLDSCFGWGKCTFTIHNFPKKLYKQWKNSWSKWIFFVWDIRCMESWKLTLIGVKSGCPKSMTLEILSGYLDERISKELSKHLPQSWTQGKENSVDKDSSYDGVNPCLGVVRKECGRLSHNKEHLKAWEKHWGLRRSHTRENHTSSNSHHTW